MKKYQHNPDIFRSHFSGQGLPAFKGNKTQYGYGIKSILKRSAIPLLNDMAKFIAPLVVKGSKNVAQKAMKRVAPNNPRLQQMVSDGIGQATALGINTGSKALKRQSGFGARERKRRKRDIFS